ncbi:geranylgeranylglycerol-phosphate geranylgeranyltransferase [Cytophagaceae bacterium ABcell3]|nr:geranylgeranylglycerol-phosphate geranylgeranyltransferase [Cytophagaceae bacterium ABcell3]
MKNNLLKHLRYVLRVIYRLVRLQNLVIIALSQYFVALFIVGKYLPHLETLFSFDLFILVCSTVSIAAGGYIINDYYDVKIDIINKPQKVVVGRYLNRRIAMVAHLGFTVAGVLLGAALNWRIMLINIACGGALWLYSNELKRQPFSGNFVVALLTGVAVVLPSYYFQAGLAHALVYGGFAFFISLIREIVKDMEDARGDASFGCKTLPVLWGIRRTRNFIFIISGIFLSFILYASFFISSQLFVALIVLVIFPVSYLLYQLSNADTIKEFHKVSVLCKIIMLSGLAGMIFI